MKKSRLLSVLLLSAAFALALPLSAGASFSSQAVDITDVFLESSSTLWEPGYDHNAYNLMDNSLSTEWTEGAPGNGVGEYVNYYIPNGTSISGGILYTGHLASEDLFQKNGAPSKLRVSSGNVSAVVDVTAYADSYFACRTGYSFSFNPPLVSDGIVKVSIESVRDGWLYADACISELRFTGTLPAFNTGMSVPVLENELSGYAVQSSSTLREYGQDYSPSLLSDHNLSTCWTEGASGSGAGEYLDLSIPSGTSISGGVLYTGFLKNEELFFNNAAPTRLRISSGQSAATVDVSAYANSYSQSRAGYRFSFNPPLISNGTVRVSIQNVREGWLYKDACISELRFTGWNAQNPWMGVTPSPTPVPTATPVPYYASGDSFVDGYGRTVYLPENWLNSRTTFIELMYKKLADQQGLPAMDIHLSDLSSDQRAYLLYAFQYHSLDDRIYSYRDGTYHYADIMDLWDIWSSLIGTLSYTDRKTFLTNYVVHRENDYCYMKATGESTDTGAFRFTDATISGVDSTGRLLLVGNVESYDYRTRKYKSVSLYKAYFKAVNIGTSTHYCFDELIVGTP